MVFKGGGDEWRERNDKQIGPSQTEGLLCLHFVWVGHGSIYEENLDLHLDERRGRSMRPGEGGG